MRTTLTALLLCCVAVTPWLPAQQQALEIATLKAKGEVHCVAFSGDGKTLAFGGRGGTINVWDVVSRKEKAIVKDIAASVNAIVLSNDGNLIASRGDNRFIRIWNINAGVGKDTLLGSGTETNVLSLALTGDDTLLASGSGGFTWEADPAVRLLDVITGKERMSLNAGVEAGNNDGEFVVIAVKFSPNGTVLGAAFANGVVQLWDIATGKRLGSLEHSKIGEVAGGVYDLAISPDGRVLASAGQNSTIKLWELATRKERATLNGHDGSVWSVAFSPDGSVFASGSYDRTVKIWDSLTCKERATLEGHSDTVRAVAFSPAGKLLASGSRDGTVKLWDVSALTRAR